MGGNAAAVFGFKQEFWDKGKREAIHAIVRAGRDSRRGLITYSDLAKQISSIKLEPHSYAMDLLLDQISKEEYNEGRGILTALVVLKDEGVPADGFWASAADLGLFTKGMDKLAYWSGEATRVIEQCKDRPVLP